MLNILVPSVLFWSSMFTLFSEIMCWICEMRFQATNLPEEEQIWVRFRNWWFLCGLGGVMLMVWLLLSSFVSSLC